MDQLGTSFINFLGKLEAWSGPNFGVNSLKCFGGLIGEDARQTILPVHSARNVGGMAL